MSSRLHAWQRLPLACALSLALAAGMNVLGHRIAVPTSIMAETSGDIASPPKGPGTSRPPSPGGSFASLAIPASESPSPPWAINRRAPEIPWEGLRRVVAGEAKTLDLSFRGGRIQARASVARVARRSETSYTLLGDIEGRRGNGSWSLARKDDKVVANFRLPDGGPSLEWRVSPEGLATESEILAERLPPCEEAFPEIGVAADDPGPTVPRDQAPEASRVAPSPPPPPDMGDDPVPVPEIAVLVVYTPAAVTAVGGASAMEALVYLAVDETNAALADSLAQPRLRLVHHQELAYQETPSSDMASDLIRLQTPSDGYLDEVADLRDLVGADLVSMIVVNDLSCGRAYTLVSNPANFSNYAFSVVAHDCVATNYTFSHEIAHNLGCQHAAGDDAEATASIFPYAHGWHFNAASADGTHYRTIMARPPGLRVPFYSNPNILVAGAVAGSPTSANCARTINMIGPIATEWRTTPATLFGNAIGQPEWIFQSGGDAPWTVQPIERRDGHEALQVGLVPDGGNSWLQTIREGPLQLDFYWKVDFGDPTAALVVTVDGVEYGRIQGGNGWKRESVRLATGSHLVRWTQSRENGGDALDALAWIDGLRASEVPMVIHEIHTDGIPVGEVEFEFESIPFQDYVLEITSDFELWRPLSPITPDDPSARVTEFHAILPSASPPEIRKNASFRIRMLE
jgi:hypothetical protein